MAGKNLLLIRCLMFLYTLSFLFYIVLFLQRSSLFPFLLFVSSQYCLNSLLFVLFASILNSNVEHDLLACSRRPEKTRKPRGTFMDLGRHAPEHHVDSNASSWIKQTHSTAISCPRINFSIISTHTNSMSFYHPANGQLLNKHFCFHR